MASILRLGSRGDEVKRLQQMLGITADGVFGNDTLAAVKKYQQANGLKVDGIVGDQTWAKLGTTAAAPATGTPAPATGTTPPTPSVGAGQGVSGYGFVSQFLDAHPDVRNIVNQAVAGNWDTSRFQTALEGTDWYRSRTEAQRKWDVESVQDPTQAAKLRTDATNQVRNLAGQWGVTLTDAQVEELARQMYVNGADEATLRLSLADLAAPEGAAPPTMGGVGQAVEEIRRMAYEYGVPVSDSRLNSWARDVVGGKGTTQGFEGYFQQAATSLYPQFAQQLQAGMTTRDLFDPYIQIAQRTLEVSPEQVDIMDPKWVPVTQTPDGQQVLSLQEWQRKLRSDASYGFQYTAGARDEAYGMTSRLARMFGNYG